MISEVEILFQFLLYEDSYEYAYSLLPRWALHWCRIRKVLYIFCLERQCTSFYLLQIFFMSCLYYRVLQPFSFNKNQFLYNYVNMNCWVLSDCCLFRYNSAAAKGRRKREKLSFCYAWTNDGWHRSKQIPRIWNSRRCNVRHEDRHYTFNTCTRPYGHPRCGATGMELITDYYRSCCIFAVALKFLISLDWSAVFFLSKISPSELFILWSLFLC